MDRQTFSYKQKNQLLYSIIVRQKLLMLTFYLFDIICLQFHFSLPTV